MPLHLATGITRSLGPTPPGPSRLACSEFTFETDVPRIPQGATTALGHEMSEYMTNTPSGLSRIIHAEG